jgi:hypothetical protein
VGDFQQIIAINKWWGDWKYYTFIIPLAGFWARSLTII